jgi:uncharacterized protein
MTALRTITPQTARRLAIAAQHLNGFTPQAAMLDMIRHMGCLQLDPTNVVARNHLLVLWSRLGTYDVAAFERLLWQERHLFEYWAHAASIVLTENYPIHAHLMRHTSEGGKWYERMAAWVQQHDALRLHVIDTLRERGACEANVFYNHEQVSRTPSRWSSGRNVNYMLDYMWTMGEILVSARKNAATRVWDLAERVLPSGTDRTVLTHDEVTHRAAQVSLRALGVGTAKHIRKHFTRNHYPNFPAVFKRLVAEQQVIPLQVADGAAVWKDPWYIHPSDLPLLARLEADEWDDSHTTLLSPFDNLICDRERTELLFGFFFRLEIYVPKDKRQYGYFTMPILHGDGLIGRVSPILDRKTATLNITHAHAEADAPAAAAPSVQGALERLATWLAAKQINGPQWLPSA